MLDLKADCFAQRRWFLGLPVALLLMSLTRDVVLTGSLPDIGNMLFHCLFPVLSVSGWMTAREAYHRLLAYFSVVADPVYIALLCSQPRWAIVFVMPDKSLYPTLRARALGARERRCASHRAMPKLVPMLSFALLLASVAFWPQYLAKNWSSIEGCTHTRAALGTLWLLILLAQPLLMVRGHTVVRRITGRASPPIGFGFVAPGVLLTRARVSRVTEAEFAKEGIYIYLPLVVALLFGIACALGFRCRRASRSTCALHDLHRATAH